MGITAHFIDADWKLHAFTLDCNLLEGSHTGEAIHAAFNETLEEFKVKDHLLAVSLDNASSNNRFMELLTKSFLDSYSSDMYMDVKFLTSMY